ncbi:HK97 family phage prohead protease [Parvibaculum sp. MBR-TMA-1.3b-4.2]|jgi:HK97 family phage prohead protease
MKTIAERGRKHGHRDLKVREVDFEVKSLKEDGTFEGYGSVFDVLDSYQEIVAKGAFTESLKERAAKKRPLPMLWQHNSREPIGFYTEVKEDDYGLLVKGQLLVDKVARATEAYHLMQAGVVTGLSIGYWVRESSRDEKTGIRTLMQLDLEEISPVTFPANDEARIEAVKFKLAHGALPTKREFEKILREAGFSKSQTVTIANHGFSEFLRREAAGEPSGNSAMETLLKEMEAEARKFELPKLD